MKNMCKKYSNLSNIIFKKFSSGTLISKPKIYSELDNHENPELDPFIISTKTGFLPRVDPIIGLPNEYDVINNILDRMSWYQNDGSPGLLQKFQFADTIKSELPMFDNFDHIKDKMVLLALYRDYSYLTSAYLLEPCHHNMLSGKGEGAMKYGKGRDFLPKNIAIPFSILAKKVNQKPFMEYNSCYGLNNWYRLDKKKGIEIYNTAIHRTFINIKSEHGFINVHVAINQHSPTLIKAGVDMLSACSENNRELFDKNLSLIKDVMSFMNYEFERMYIESTPQDYNIFRTFIMGITNQPMFKEGVVYEGCFENKPQFYRGESGANDNIIPFVDNIIEITGFMPNNPLTEILRDFRSYRPMKHQEFLAWTENYAKSINVIEYAKKNNNSLFALLEVANQNRIFRHRHWNLTNMYIIGYSKHPVATGGSPITTYLSNQLVVVCDFIKLIAKSLDVSKLDSNSKYRLECILKSVEADLDFIKNEVQIKRRVFNQ